MKGANNAEFLELLPASKNSSVDRLLRAAVNQAIDQRLQTIAELQSTNPELSVEAIERRMEDLAKEQLPDSHRSAFWTSEMDQILIAGSRGGLEAERKAVQKVLSILPDLRRGTIRQRQRALARRIQTGKSQRGRKYNWTAELDDRLQRACDRSGCKAAVSEMQKTTGWPRAAIYADATSSAFRSSGSRIKGAGAP